MFDLDPPELVICFFSFAEFCLRPPNLRHATFKATTYEMGTLLNCDCKKGFLISRGSVFMNCTGNAGHSAWENQCQCKMNCKCFLL